MLAHRRREEDHELRDYDSEQDEQRQTESEPDQPQERSAPGRREPRRSSTRSGSPPQPPQDRAVHRDRERCLTEPGIVQTTGESSERVRQSGEQPVEENQPLRWRGRHVERIIPLVAPPRPHPRAGRARRRPARRARRKRGRSRAHERHDPARGDGPAERRRGRLCGGCARGERVLPVRQRPRRSARPNDPLPLRRRRATTRPRPSAKRGSSSRTRRCSRSSTASEPSTRSQSARI